MNVSSRPCLRAACDQRPYWAIIEGSDGDTIEGIAGHLAREKFERDVLALDEDGRVVHLGPIDRVYPQAREVE
jgi:hypothetical protein